MSRQKRWFDVLGATCGLIVFAPVMAVIAAAVLLDGRPVLFRQTRLGRGRRRFTILKFRSMLPNGDVTPVGRVLRATGLDELPQFINILRGDMSAVGPRPLTEADVERLGWTGPDWDFRWLARPGLTGLAQLAGSDSPEASMELDRAYLADPSAALDCRLIALSFAVNVLGKTRVRQWFRRAQGATRG